jgi:hypothetical protein
MFAFTKLNVTCIVVCFIDKYRYIQTNLSIVKLLKPTGFFTYYQVSLKNSATLCVDCFERVSEQAVTFALYIINWLGIITVVESAYCALRTDSLYKEKVKLTFL